MYANDEGATAGTTQLPIGHHAARRRRSATTSALGLCAALLLVGWPAKATVYTTQATPLAPVPGSNNQAVLTLTNITPGFCNPTCASDTQTSFVQPGSTMDFEYDSVSQTVTITDADLTMSDVTYFPILKIKVTNIHFVLDLTKPAPQGAVDPLTHEVAMLLPAIASATVLGLPLASDVTVPFAGTFALQMPGPGGVNSMSLYNPATEISPVVFFFTIGPTTFTFQLTGTITFNFEGAFPQLFDDGFESGTTAAWTATVGG